MKWSRSWLVFTCLAACAPEAIVIAHKAIDADLTDAGDDAESQTDAESDAASNPDVDAENDAALPADTCTNSDDCGEDRFCRKRRCDDALGVCTLRYTVCSSKQEPVCGCDGLSYFNDCIRSMHGVEASVPGHCLETARTCGPPLLGPECPPRTYCARLRSTPEPSGLPCELDLITTPGRCWVLPPEGCGFEPFGGEYTLCGEITGAALGGAMSGGASPGGGGSPGGSSGSACVTACEAIRSEQAHTRTVNCLK